MKISEFIKETLTQIIQGVSDTNEKFETKGAYVASKDVSGGNVIHRKEGSVLKNVVMVDFDIAVTVSQKNEKNKGIKADLKVASFGVSADFGGDNSTEKQEISRVKFSLPLVLNDDLKAKASKTGIRVTR